MNKTRTFLKALKVVVINSLIFSLLQNPFISDALAAGKAPSTSLEANDVLKIANGAVNLYQNYLGQKYQIIQAQIASAQNQKLMSQLSPSCRKADGTACYVAQAKYFPECQIPASMSNMPANACSSNTADPNAISTMLTYESIAQGWMNYYDQMSNEASNAAYPVGLRCLQDKQKAIDSQLTEMMNSLQRLQDRLNQDKQVFRDNNKKLLEDMNTANDELFGSTKNNLKIKTQDFTKFFSQSCQAVIGKDNLKNGTSVGLNGILQNLSGVNKSAADFNLNKGAIENDIRRETEKIASTIRTGGIDDFLQNGYIPQSDEAASTFVAIKTQINKQNAELKVALDRIQKTLKDVDYPMPTLSSNFSTDMEGFMAGANDYFKKKYINDCVTGADKGIAIPVDDILKSLEQRSTNSEGTARNDYRAALKKILDSDSMIADKMAQIKALESDYPGMTVTYKDSTQNNVTESPYSLFMKTIDRCEQRYTQDDTFANKSNRTVSYQKKVERAKEALAELKTLNDGYASKVSASVLSQVLDCGGSSLKSGSCSEDTLNSKGDNFCIAHASQCANEIQGCYAEANTQVQVRKTKMENLAKKFNDNVAQMIARSNALYEQQKAAVTNVTKLIQARFPGTNFEIPKDMFVSMPELKKDTYGVELAGDGKIESFLEGPTSMPEKISLLKEMFKRQKTEVDKSVAEYIDLQKSAMDREKNRWSNLKEKCTASADAAIKGAQMANQEGQKKQAEEDGKVGEFCSRYNGLADNPLGACDDAKDLATDMKKIAGRLDPAVAGNVNAFRQMCNQYNNESDVGTESTTTKKTKRAAGKTASLKAMCVNSDGTGVKSDDDLMASIKKISPSLRKNLPDGALAYIKGDSSTAPNVTDEDTKDLLDRLKADFSTGSKADSSKISSKFKNDEAYKKVALDNSICGNIMKAQIASADNDAKFDDLNSAAGASTTFSKGDNTISLLKELAAGGAGSVEDKASDLGEKLSGAPCDMQNKSNMAKSPLGGFDLNGFDSKILGKNQ